MTIHAKIDLCGDDTIWATEIYSEAGHGLICQIFNKPSITKGSTKVLVSDIRRIRSCAYMRIQKSHVKPPVWNLWRNIGVKEITEVMKVMVERE